MNIEQELKALEDARKSEETSASQKREREQRIREEIAQGKTTGDRIRDLVIAKYGCGDMEAITKTLHDVEAKLQGKRGQYAAVIETTTRVTIGERGIVCPVNRRSYYRPSIGVLNGDALILTEKRDGWGLPTSQHFHRFKDNADVRPGGLFLTDKFQRIFDLGSDVYRESMPFLGNLTAYDERKVAVLIGDEELLRWLLSREDDGAADDRQHSNIWWIRMFTWMARKLDRDLGEMPLLAETLKGIQERLIQELKGLKVQRDMIRRCSGNPRMANTNPADLIATNEKIRSKLAVAAGYGITNRLVRNLERADRRSRT